MAFDDLRSFLQALDDQGQLLKISEEGKLFFGNAGSCP